MAAADAETRQTRAVTDERRASARAEGEPLDPVALARRVQAEDRAGSVSGEMLDRWLDRSGLTERDDAGGLHLTAEAQALAGRAFG
jgi:hypothetical protein